MILAAQPDTALPFECIHSYLCSLKEVKALVQRVQHTNMPLKLTVLKIVILYSSLVKNILNLTFKLYIVIFFISSFPKCQPFAPLLRSSHMSTTAADCIILQRTDAPLFYTCHDIGGHGTTAWRNGHDGRLCELVWICCQLLFHFS